MNLKFSLRLEDAQVSSEYADILTRAFARKLRDRGCGLAPDGYPIRIVRDSGCAQGAYRLLIGEARAELAASDPCAYFAGLGEFLLGWRFPKGGDPVIPARTFAFQPQNAYRGLYFATHFYNFYHTAPLDQVTWQVEDVAFRGGNAIAVWYDMHHFSSFDEPESRQMVERLKAILRHAVRIGMKTCLTMLSNEAFMGTPDALKASSAPQNGYHAVLDGHYGVEICPSKPHGIEEIIRQRRIVLRGFADMRPDYIVYWPYDQGGCTCKDCAPWGTNGFLRLLPHFENVVHEEMPGTKLIVSTWNFDLFIDGEWARFHTLAENGCVAGAEYLMDFFYHSGVPTCILEKGLPGGKKMLSFPEISMYGGKPWGGFGANPLPAFLQKTNDMGENIYSGESCYSEGIFEDINKTIMLLSCSGREKDTRRAIADYASWEYMTDDAADIIRLAEMTEQTLPRNQVFGPDEVRFEIKTPDQVKPAAELARRIDAAMPEPARSGWRWRILYLRALIDEQLMKDGWRVTKDCDGYLRELEQYYYIVPQSRAVVSPPTTDVVKNKWLKNTLI